MDIQIVQDSRLPSVPIRLHIVRFRPGGRIGGLVVIDWAHAAQRLERLPADKCATDCHAACKAIKVSVLKVREEASRARVSFRLTGELLGINRHPMPDFEGTRPIDSLDELESISYFTWHVPAPWPSSRFHDKIYHHCLRAYGCALRCAGLPTSHCRWRHQTNAAAEATNLGYTF